jgi:hypothetical protein
LKKLKSVFSLLCICPAALLYAQSFSGQITNEKNEPIPFANIFIQELSSGTSTDEKGKYFIHLYPGNYHVVYSCIGYKTRTYDLIITEKPVINNVTLQVSSIELEEIVVKSRSRDPAYEIIRKAIESKEKHLSPMQSFRTQVYVRAMEVVDVKKKKNTSDSDDPPKDPTVDPMLPGKSEEQKKLEQTSFLEMQMTLNHRSPDHYKEERTAYKLYGTKEGLFIPVFSDININFYENLVQLKGISEVPLISPLSKLAILSYRYKLEEMIKDGDRFVYKIKVIPRKAGDATCTGYVYINDGTWSLDRVDLTIVKGALKFYDRFGIRQNYHTIGDDISMPIRQEFEYETKAGRKNFKGNTVLVFSAFERNYKFPPKFFGNEVSVMTKDALDRDSAFWSTHRADPLTAEQQKVIAYRDSIEKVHKSKAYLDSVETKFNKVTIGEVILHGVGFRSEEKKSSIYFSSLVSLIGFEVVGGLRLGPYCSYFRTYKNGRTHWTNNSISVGFKNRDFQFHTTQWLRYDPFRLGDVSLRMGRSFYSINNFDAYLNQLKISNYILHEHIDISHRIELINGLYTGVELAFHNRKPVTNLDPTSIINEVLEETEPLEFQPYQAMISRVSLSYTPGQQYMREPNRKVVLGSKFPTITLAHKRGWPDLLTSDVNFDFLEASLDQRFQVGTLGSSRYNFTAGTFVNTKTLEYIDLKRFRQSDPYLYSDPMHSFQALDTSLSATGLFLEAHYIHHFNGALVNNLPLIKKLKLRTVAGAGGMWVEENNFRHQEMFGGLERVFKMGARRRLRIGVFGVLSQTNNGPLLPSYKISFDIIDTWKREWSY